jgi:hypothetical protein
MPRCAACTRAAAFMSEFTAVTDVKLAAENERHAFVAEALRGAGVEAVSMEAFAVWTARLRPMIQ